MNKIYLRKNKYPLLLMIVIIFSFFIINNFNSSIRTKNYIPNKIYVHYIDVGQGDSILVQVNNKNLLIDSGPKSDKYKLLDYLDSLDIHKIDYVLATHPHEDHIGNMSSLIKKYEISHFYAPKVESTTKSFESMVEALKSKKLKINIIKKGTDSINLGSGTRVTVFSPIETSYDNLNNYSPVIKIEYGNSSFLFTGDAEKEIEIKLISNSEDINADILKVGHHGSSTSSSEEFIKKVNPSIAVISVGEDNTYDHPTDITLSHLKENNVKIYRTDQQGTIIFSSDGYTITQG